MNSRYFRTGPAAGGHRRGAAIVVFEKQAGDTVQKGDVLARLVSPELEHASSRRCSSGGAVGHRSNRWRATGLRRTTDGWRLDVLDRGAGMNEAVLSNALLPFCSTKRNGTGLGLALAWEIAEACGGRIALLNREDGGLCVSLVLPDSGCSSLSHRERDRG